MTRLKPELPASQHSVARKRAPLAQIPIGWVILAQSGEGYRAFTRLCLGLVLLALLSFPGWAAPAFKVEASVDRNRLSPPGGGRSQRLWVKTRVTNTGQESQEVIIWTQQGWSWTCDHARISAGMEALQNIPVRHKLQPGQSFDGGVELLVVKPLAGPAEFRLGFSPSVQSPVVRNSRPKAQGFFWSNPLVIR